MTSPSNQLEVRRVEARPAADVFENDSAYQIVLDVPGTTQADVSVTVEERALRVSARRALDEQTQLAYARSFALPEDVDDDAVTAELSNGVLRITLRKRSAPAPRQITIRAA